MSNPRNLDEMFDLVVSYDKEDSIKYNIGYCPTSFSEIRIPVPTKISTDVYFLGKAKDRMAKIVEVYNLLTNKGLVCDFYVSGVTDKEKYSYSGIHFIEKMSYVDNLKHVASSNCILDIQQGNAKGFTLRIWEAINFNKKLITDNNEFCMSEFYSKDFVIKIDEIANLDMKSIVSRDCCSNKYAEFIRPTRLIEYLDLNVQ